MTSILVLSHGPRADEQGPLHVAELRTRLMSRADYCDQFPGYVVHD